jgi:hypothetical protein
VPVWFVPQQVLRDAIDDGVLTIGEFAALLGLVVGHATGFREVLHPSPLSPALGGGGISAIPTSSNRRSALRLGFVRLGVAPDNWTWVPVQVDR